jgi:hypothetical protein
MEDVDGRLCTVEDDTMPPPRVDSMMLLTEELWKEKAMPVQRHGAGSSSGSHSGEQRGQEVIVA